MMWVPARRMRSSFHLLSSSGSGSPPACPCGATTYPSTDAVMISTTFRMSGSSRPGNRAAVTAAPACSGPGASETFRAGESQRARGSGNAGHRCKGLVRLAGPSRSGLRGRRVPRLVDRELLAVGEADRGDQSPALLGHAARHLDSLAPQFRERGLDVVAHQVELMPRVP